jgi:hypothetical protein
LYKDLKEIKEIKEEEEERRKEERRREEKKISDWTTHKRKQNTPNTFHITYESQSRDFYQSI